METLVINSSLKMDKQNWTYNEFSFVVYDFIDSELS